MIKKSALVVILFLFSFVAFAQEKTQTHTVVRGETVRTISLKYHITPYDLIRINPDVVDPPTVGSVLVIPVVKDESGIMVEAKELVEKKENQSKHIIHEVKEKETLFSLSRKYKVKVDDLFDLNPELVKGLKIGMKLRIPEPTVKDKYIKRDTSKYIFHVIEPKETRWGICHKYTITEEEFLNTNPGIAQKMNVGDTVWISKSSIKVIDQDENINYNYTYYEVKPKDTTYGISKKFSISIDELKIENPLIVKEGLEVGMVLKIPRAPHPIYDTTKVEVITMTNLPNDSVLTNNEKIDELDKMDFPKIVDVVLMLPFYTNRNGQLIKEVKKGVKPIKSENEEIEGEEGMDDLFYSRSAIALEFYNGAMFAIDSLKKMGLSVRLRVFDTQKNLEVVKRIMNENDFRK
jgi:LysM repeat protein